MVPSLRKAYNARFTQEKYNAYLEELNSAHPGAIEFRVAETPVFVPNYFRDKMLEACESIIDVILDPRFKQNSEKAIPANIRVEGENDHCHFMVFDFGVCENEDGELEPQLIEMQGFPTMFAFQVFQPEVLGKHFEIPGNFDCYLGNLTKTTYLESLKSILVGNEAPENVILLELFPHQQKTRVDFYCTTDYLGIKPVCVTELIQEGRKLYYMNEGKKTLVSRIYNRIIFDDLQHQSPEVQQKARILSGDLDVEWIPHPNWYYRISKYTLPFIRSPYVPPTFFLSEVKQMPRDLENFVLKPLFSYAGQGVIIDVTKEDLENIQDPENWILQRKVKYADVIETPDIPAKVEIRLFYFWAEGTPRPVPANNLARLSKGKMIGVRYNQDKEWVGGTFCLFDQS
jgi:hypothetical protein